MDYLVPVQVHQAFADFFADAPDLLFGDEAVRS